jgi:tetratricopeptide (TPR) repeat protein
LGLESSIRGFAAIQEIGLQQVFAEIDKAFAAHDLNRVEALLWPALNQFIDLPQLWFYAGNLLYQTDKIAMSVRAFERCLELGENPLVMANLGAAYRRLNAHDEGIAVLTAALDRNPNYAPALVNLGSMFVNEGCPDRGIPYLERAVALGKASGRYEQGSTWNLALLYLEAGRFAEGFEMYSRGVGDERLIRNYGKESKGVAEPELLQPSAEGQGQTLIVWGEQGIGDELMFSTCLLDALHEFGKVIFECHPRLEWIYEQTFKAEIETGRLKLYPTRKDDHIEWPVTDNHGARYKCPIGDLAARYRRSLADFSKEGRVVRYAYDRAESDRFRAKLEQFAQGRKLVGLATRGGVLQTARTYRTLKIADADQLFQNTDCVFVSLDYDDMTGFAGYCEEKYPGRFIWLPSVVQHWDYHHTAALAAACDLNVTVCQSVAHLCGVMGLNTRVLVPKRCAWRYAPAFSPASPRWYWYPHDNVMLYREDKPNDWSEPLARVIRDIKELA